MKVAILHLSDLHIDKDNYQWLIKKTEPIVAAVWNDFSECGKIIIAVSGDIANAGKEEQYGYAKLFFRELLKAFAQKNLKGIELENKVICVPGNHDCDFEKDTTVRKMLLASMRSGGDSIDKSVYDTVATLQDNYRGFAKDMLIDKTLALSINNNIPIKAGSKTILFRLFNTAWMSSLREEQNSIVMPIEMIAQESIDADFVISLFHHYYSWLAPACDNKSRFRKNIIKTSNIVLFGHEHTSSSLKINDHYENEVINEFEGGALFYSRQGCPKASAFNSIVIDIDTFECVA